MITIYWSPWLAKDIYDGLNILYQPPKSLSKYYADLINKDNIHDNFLKCPAHVNLTKNIFYLESPYDVSLVYQNNQLHDISTNKASNMNDFCQIKTPSLERGLTVNLYMNWVFFSDTDLFLESTPPYMHKTSMVNSGFYVPGTYNISRWFRPLEGALQLWDDNITSLQLKCGDPLMYVKFNTNEKINFKRFYLSDEIRDISRGCMHVKRYKTIKDLTKLYEIFTSSKTRLRLLNEIKRNVV